MRETVSCEFGLDRAKVVVLPPSAPHIDVETEGRCDVSPRERCGSIRLLYVGNSTKAKNLEVAAKAVSLLRMDGLCVELVATIEAEHDLCRAGSLTALGYLDMRALAQEFAKADVLLMPSLVETVGLPMLEAMARGLPVIAADRDYARDLCSSAAMYFDPLDEEALANALRAVLADAHVWKRLRTAGLARAAELRDARPYDRLIELAIAA
jgi:glycosyltransferase involved in cell wall biosynthesis